MKQKPDHADALHLAGVIAYQTGRNEIAVERIQKALSHAPETGLYYANLGNVLRNMGRFAAALEAYQNAIQYKPDFAQAYYNAGLLYSMQGNPAEAITWYRKALEIEPNYPEVHNNLGNVLKEQGMVEEALNSYRNAIKINPDYYQAFNNMGNIFKDQGRTEDDVACYRKAVRIKPDFVEAYNNMGNTLIYDRNRVDEAWNSFSKALESKPDDLWAVAGQAKVLMRKGEFEAAYQHLLPCTETNQVNIDIAVTYAQLAVRFNDHERAIQLLERFRATGLRSNDERRQVLYNLGDLYDKTGQFEQAFERYQEANALRKLKFNPDQFQATITRLMAAYPRGYGQRLPKAVNHSELPVFIIGMPRSGTSLVEQIISSHSRCFGAGELPYIVRMVNTLKERLTTQQPYPECLPQITRRNLDGFAQSYLQYLLRFSRSDIRITDKMPLNFIHLGFISLLFPKARVIHCVRDPRDTGLSIFFQNFSDGHPYAVDLTNIGHYYRQYQRLMHHWEEVLEIPMITVKYETLIDDQEAQSRGIIDFLGLEWEEQCLQFYKSERSVSTASYEQVRQPIYKRSVQRWKNYEPYIQPMMNALEGFSAS